MNNKTDKGFFIIHDKTDRFHVGAFIVYDKFFKECYLFLCLGKHDFSIGYRWKWLGNVKSLSSHYYDNETYTIVEREVIE